MTKHEVAEILEEAGFPVAYHHFEEGQCPELPYIVYLFPETRNIPADGNTFIKIDELDVELYTEKKEIKTEEILEQILDHYGFRYQKRETYIETERMYEVLYEMEV